MMAGIPTNSTKFPGLVAKRRILLNPEGTSSDVIAAVQTGVRQFNLMNDCHQPELYMTTDAEGKHDIVVSCVHGQHPEISLAAGIAS